jgi:uncharacterized protein YndB with AHSA1/START domain
MRLYSATHVPDPKLDLVLERVVDVPPELVWAAWTQPKHLMKWFCPKPWTTIECEIDLRPGGIFRTTMQSPEGQKFPGTGCYLEVIENEKLIWTSVLGPGFRPIEADAMGPMFTAIIALQPQGKGTKYTATAIHRDEKGCQAHAKMGFHDGWGKCLDQLVEMAKTMKI